MLCVAAVLYVFTHNAQTHTHTHTHTHARTHAHTHTYVCVCVLVCMYCVCVEQRNIDAHIPTPTHIRTERVCERACVPHALAAHRTHCRRRVCACGGGTPRTVGFESGQGVPAILDQQGACVAKGQPCFQCELDRHGVSGFFLQLEALTDLPKQRALTSVWHGRSAEEWAGGGGRATAHTHAHARKRASSPQVLVRRLAATATRTATTTATKTSGVAE
jgi:hypothetical protein